MNSDNGKKPQRVSYNSDDTGLGVIMLIVLAIVVLAAVAGAVL